MTGLNGQRVYLDWNATAPLRPEARAAMLEAMDVVGNPSSVHAEGRAAKAIVEKARGQVAALVGCDKEEVVFTSGATEAAAGITLSRLSVMARRPDRESGWASVPDTAHDCLIAQRFSEERDHEGVGGDFLAMGLACGETGVLTQPKYRQYRSTSEVVPGWFFRDRTGEYGPAAWLKLDATQLVGKLRFNFRQQSEKGNQAVSAFFSSHKIAGPKGVGATLERSGFESDRLLQGGGQEKGRRSGTENVIGIAGFGAAAEAAQRDLESQVWDRVEKLRNILEDTLASAAPDTIFFGKESPRLPNTSCFAVPGWRGETQVMQMDLAGFAISAGSACSSGKVEKASRVLLAMGFDEETASSAIRVSMGPTTTEAEILAFADSWIDAYRRRKARAA